jgi:hypothetical protein
MVCAEVLGILAVDVYCVAAHVFVAVSPASVAVVVIPRVVVGVVVTVAIVIAAIVVPTVPG